MRSTKSAASAQTDVYARTRQSPSRRGHLLAASLFCFAWAVSSSSVTANSTVGRVAVESSTPGVRWRALIAGGKDCWINRLVRTHDGGILAVGYVGRDRNPAAPERWSAVAVKFTADGQQVWRRVYPAEGMNAFWSVRELVDGRFVLGGFSSAKVGEPYDARLTMLDAKGTLLFSRTFGGPRDDRATDVLQTQDGGFLLIGQTESFGAGERDVLAVKTDRAGAEQWRKAYGGPGMDRGFAGVETSDGGFVLAGTTGSEAKIDGLIFKIDGTGRELWRRTIPGDKNVIPHAIGQLSGGRILVTGYTDSWGARGTDFLAVTLAGDGAVQRIEILGGDSDDHGITSSEDGRGGAWLAGYSKSFGTTSWTATLVHIRPDGGFDPTVLLPDPGPQSYATSVVALPGGDLVVGGYAKRTGEVGDILLMASRLDPKATPRATSGLHAHRPL